MWRREPDPKRGQAYEMQVHVFPRQGGATPRSLSLEEPLRVVCGQNWGPLRLACQAGPSGPGLSLLRERGIDGCATQQTPTEG